MKRAKRQPKPCKFPGCTVKDARYGNGYCAAHSNVTTVNLTMVEAEQVEWAIGPMDDLWCTEDGAHGRDGKVYEPSSLPALDRSYTDHVNLALSEVEEINSDLLYRLEVQLQDMADEEVSAEAKATARAGMKAAKKIRAKSNLASLPIGGGWV